MRISLLTPLRRHWPVSAAAAGRTYQWKAMVPDWPTEIYSRQLPDGRFEISMDGVAPAVISPGLSCTRTNYQCWQILRLLDVYGKWFARQHGLRLPIKTGRFVECGAVFVFEDEADPYTFARLRIPRRIVVSREAG
jgi:hypothetical protein